MVVVCKAGGEGISPQPLKGRRETEFFSKHPRPPVGGGELRKTKCFSELGCLPAGRQGLLSCEQKVQECDATDDAQGTEAGNKKYTEEIASASPHK